MGESYLDYVEARDKVMVLTKGEQTLYGYYEQLILDPNSQVFNFFRSNEDKQEIKSTGKKSSKKLHLKAEKGVQKK